MCTRTKIGLLPGNAENMAAGQLEQYGWSNFFDELTTFLVDIDRNTGTLSERYTEYVLERIPVCLRAIRQIILVLNTDVEMTEDETDIVSQYIEELNTLFSSLCVIASEWERHLDRIIAAPSLTAYRAPSIHVPGTRGRPRFDISESQLEYLSSLSFSWTQIASLLGVSRMTIYRRRMEFNMGDAGVAINDHDLKLIIRRMKADLPHMGEVLLMGRIRSNGYRVTRERLRAAIREIDPLNTALRVPEGRTARRPYNVPGPNSLWHIGNDTFGDNTVASLKVQ